MRWVLDNSVLQRMPRTIEIANAVASLLDGGHELCWTQVLALEAGFSVRSAAEHDRLLAALQGFALLPLDPRVGETALELQRRLWAAGRGRAVGARDLLTAGSAVVHSAGILHYDSDFEMLSEVDDRVRQRWVVPRGTVD